MKKEKGITLIALVITIIILLILAGISIATLTGENGLLTKANIAKTEIVKKSAEEKVKIAVAGSLGTNGKIDLNDLNDNLRQVEGLTDILYNDTSIFADNKIEKLPIEVVVDGYVVEIDENGKVTLKQVKPVVDYELSETGLVPDGTTITVTVTATISGGERITKITLYDGTEVTGKSTTTFEVTKNGYYPVEVEGSNGEKTTCMVKVTNIGNGEIFSDIYTETKTFIDENGKTARIPEGFAVGESSTINKIDNGLVITDGIDEFHRSTGNEFVWIPVDNSDDFKLVDGYNSGRKQTKVSAGQSIEPYSGGCQEERNLYEGMRKSVTDEMNNGFYVGRFEAGVGSGGAVVSRPDVPAYVNVKWGNSMTDLNGVAVQLAKEFINDKSYKHKVTSMLIFGVQWDATMQFFDNNHINGTCDENSYVRDSTGRGYYYSSVRNIGYYSVKNIYDMAGNVWEWTMEADTVYKSRGFRGGSYDYTNTGLKYPVSSRNPNGLNVRIQQVADKLSHYFMY